jgi:hypothetical protein
MPAPARPTPSSPCSASFPFPPALGYPMPLSLDFSLMILYRSSAIFAPFRTATYLDLLALLTRHCLHHEDGLRLDDRISFPCFVSPPLRTPPMPPRSHDVNSQVGSLNHMN